VSAGAGMSPREMLKPVLEGSRWRDSSTWRPTQPESLFAPVLIRYTQAGDNAAEAGDNAGCKQMFAAERWEHRAWT
jgi:hypothetical protein